MSKYFSLTLSLSLSYVDRHQKEDIFGSGATLGSVLKGNKRKIGFVWPLWLV